MKEGYTKIWDQADSPVIWVEMIYVGDTKKMKQYLGFGYQNHYFSSINQLTTFFRNDLSEKKAEDFGNKKYSDPKFIDFFCKKSEDVERELIKFTKNIVKSKLPKLSNKQLYHLFNDFFEKYSSLAGLYRFSRPEFYEKALEENKKLYPQLKKIGERRLEMHEIWMNAFSNAIPIFKEIGKRLDLSKEEAMNCTHQEIYDGLIKEKLLNGIKRRLLDYTLVYGEDSFVLSTGKRDEEKVKIQSILKGKVAFAGKVKGKVLLILESLKGIKKIENIPKDAVLVTMMTSPDMIPIMKKVSAIVTDDGGTLCHAAIVSRELKIPCIIGTKIATRILKDGDLVEVDANKGIVRKL